MTFDISIGGRNVYSVSNTTRGIFNLIEQKLENGKKGSKYPIFFRLGEEKKISGKNLDRLMDEISKIKSELYEIQIPIPTISYYKGELELYNHSWGLEGGSFISTKDWKIGLDKKGIYHLRLNSDLNYNPTIKELHSMRENMEIFPEIKGSREYFKELKKDGPDKEVFEKISKGSQVDMIAHKLKSAEQVYEEEFNTFLNFASEAKRYKKSIN